MCACGLLIYCLSPTAGPVTAVAVTFGMLSVVMTIISAIILVVCLVLLKRTRKHNKNGT